VPYILVNEPFKEVFFYADTYTINNNFNSMRVYEDSVPIKDVSDIIQKHFSYTSRKVDSHALVPVDYPKDSATFFAHLAQDIVEGIWKDDIKDLKLGQYEIKIFIQNTSTKTFKQPKLNIKSNFIYFLSENGSDFRSENPSLRKVSDSTIILSDLLKPQQIIECSIVTKDNIFSEIENGIIYNTKSFPDIYLTIGEEIVFPTHSERIYYTSAIDKIVSHTLIDFPNTQFLVFGFTIIGIYFTIKPLIRLIKRRFATKPIEQ
jgi:hypothetical protein